MRCPVMLYRMLVRPMEGLHPLSTEIMTSLEDGFFKDVLVSEHC